MEQETLFTASKWDILKVLATGGRSPMQLAQLTHTSVANVSQQLRLLEMAGLVRARRVSNRDRGQPRLIYSLVGNHSFLIASSPDFVEKRLLKLSSYNKVILKIWFMNPPQSHYFIEKAFWTVEEHIGKLRSIAVDMDTLGEDNYLVYLVGAPRSLSRNLELRDGLGCEKSVSLKPIDGTEYTKIAKKSRIYVIYDALDNTEPKLGGVDTK